jgi:hypothetical protein
VQLEYPTLRDRRALLGFAVGCLPVAVLLSFAVLLSAYNLVPAG